MGIEPVAYEALTPGEADYSAVLTAIASKGPEIIYYGGYTAELSVVINQMGQVGLKGVPVFSDDGALAQKSSKISQCRRLLWYDLRSSAIHRKNSPLIK